VGKLVEPNLRAVTLGAIPPPIDMDLLTDEQRVTLEDILLLTGPAEAPLIEGERPATEPPAIGRR